MSESSFAEQMEQNLRVAYSKVKSIFDEFAFMFNMPLDVTAQIVIEQYFRANNMDPEQNKGLSQVLFALLRVEGLKLEDIVIITTRDKNGNDIAGDYTVPEWVPDKYAGSSELEKLASLSQTDKKEKKDDNENNKLTVPDRLWNSLVKRYPNLWRNAVYMRNSKGDPLDDWGEICWLTLHGWIAALSEGDNLRAMTLGFDIAKGAAVGTWRLSKGIYRFDPDLGAELIATPLSPDSPCRLFYRLPQYCIYVDTSNLNCSLEGFFAHIDTDLGTGLVKGHMHDELRIYIIMRDGKEYPAIIHLNEGSILAGLNELHKNEVPGAADVMMDTVQVPLSLLTYLCSDDPDYGADRVPPTRAIPKKSKGSNKWIPKQRPDEWEVGPRIGATIRAFRAAKAEAEKTSNGDTSGRTVRPHVRRAHWHGYWKGSRADDAKPQKFIHRWIPPTLVNMTGDDLPTTIYQVKKENEGQ